MRRPIPAMPASPTRFRSANGLTVIMFKLP